MKYDIIYRPVFTKKERKLSGYEIFVRHHEPSLPNGDFNVLTIESKSENEFGRIEGMLISQCDPSSGLSFIDRHPLHIVKYVRGVREKIKHTTDWKNDINDWVVNSRCDRV